MVDVIDTPWNAAAHIPALKSAGVRTVIRYINHRNSRVLPEKRLERAEAEALCDAGFGLAVVFQQNARRRADFETPERDAGRAFSHAARALGQPPGSAIYFAVDHDFVRPADLTTIARYFERIVEAKEAEPAERRYAIGAYGSGTVLSMLSKAELIEHRWLAMADGWSGSRAYDAAGEWSLRQDRVSRIGRLDIDENTVGASDEFGAFTIRTRSLAPGTQARVTARRGLRLRDGPSLANRILGVMKHGTTVSVLSRGYGWAEVDSNGDGRADGHACIAFLAPA